MLPPLLLAACCSLKLYVARGRHYRSLPATPARASASTSTVAISPAPTPTSSTSLAATLMATSRRVAAQGKSSRLIPHFTRSRPLGGTSTCASQQCRNRRSRQGCQVRQTHLLRHFILKMIVLPRQARDKHKESTQNEMRFLIFVIVSHRTVRDGEPTPQVELWNLERPYLYTVQTALTTPSGMSDSINTTIGVRSALFSADSGFVLNGADKEIPFLFSSNENAHLTCPDRHGTNMRKRDKHEKRFPQGFRIRSRGCLCTRTLQVRNRHERLPDLIGNGKKA